MGGTIEVTARRALEDDERRLEPVRVGHVVAHAPSADLYVVVRDRAVPRLRIDLYGDPTAETFPFNEALWWSPWVVVGFGHAVYLVSLDGKSVTAYPLGAYFGSLHAGDGYLLIASADRLFRVNVDGRLAWVSRELGVDGVLIEDVQDGVISGRGEWDPPGDWRQFRLRLDTGRPAPDKA